MTAAAQGIALRTAVWVAIGLTGVVSALVVGLGTPLAPRGGFFPFIVCLAIVVLAVADAAVMQRTHDLGDGEEAANTDQGRKRLLVIAAVLSYAVLLPLIGSVLTMMITTFVLMFVVEHLPARLSTIVTVGTGLGLYLVFEVLLDVPLPVGWIWTSLGVA